MLSIQHLHHAYFGHLECLHDVTASFDEGVNLLLGGEGDGKTSLLKCIAGLCEYTDGSIELDGAPLRYGKEGNVGMVFDDLGLLERRSLGYNLRYPMRLRKMDKEAQEAAIRLVTKQWDILPFALETQARRAPNLLRVKVALARACLLHRRVMLLDNPLQCLSLGERQELFVLLSANLPSMGDIVLYATDSREEVKSLDAPIAMLSAGYLVATGQARDLASDPPCLHAAKLLIPLYQTREGTLKEGACQMGDVKVECHYPASYEGEQVIAGIAPDQIEIGAGEQPVQAKLWREGANYAQIAGWWVKCNLAVGEIAQPTIRSIHLYDPSLEIRIDTKKE